MLYKAGRLSNSTPLFLQLQFSKHLFPVGIQEPKIEYGIYQQHSPIGKKVGLIGHAAFGEHCLQLCIQHPLITLYAPFDMDALYRLYHMVKVHILEKGTIKGIYPDFNIFVS
ncbi:hypothetical protein BH09BAC1_BH09BAC1_04850 [soil metagenome]